MFSKVALARSTALGMVLAVGMSGGVAQAAPAKHRHRVAGPSPAEVELKGEVKALQDEVAALKSRLDSQAQAQAQTASAAQSAQAQAAAAQSQAAAAQSQLAAAQSQIQTLPDQVKTEVAAAQPKPGWWANTTVSGRFFMDVSGINNFSNGVRQPNSGADFDVKRTYLSVDHVFNKTFSTDFTTDLTYDSGTGATQLFVKKAYVQAHLSDALNFRAGSAELPWIPFVESLEGYRFVDNLLIDRTKFGTTTDWGLHMYGSVDNNLISYQVSVIDGNGFKKPAMGTVNRTDSVDVEGRVSLNYQGFTAGVGGYEGKLGHDVVGTPTYNTAYRFDAVAAYVNAKIRLGVEYFWAKHWNDVTQVNALLTNTSQGVSGFGSYAFTPHFAVFGRYDYVEPQRNTAPNFHENYFNVGIDYKPIIPKKPTDAGPLDFALVYKRDAVDDGILNTSNGLIGGSVRGTYDEIGIFSQVVF
jgi:hypothetical protein